MYIKIDDDVVRTWNDWSNGNPTNAGTQVYIQDDAIPSISRFRLNNPKPLFVSGNVINHPELSWLHWRLGAVKPFLPEEPAPIEFNPKAEVGNWRTSELTFIKHFNYSDYDWKEPAGPHRWLPVDTRTGVAADYNLDHTPISSSAYDPFGKGWSDWRLAAQQHYSFFQNAEEGEKELKNYKFESWDMNYGRLSINFMAIWGRDVLASAPFPRDDEAHLTITISKKTGRREWIFLFRRGFAKTNLCRRGCRRTGIGLALCVWGAKGWVGQYGYSAAVQVVRKRVLREAA